MWFRSKENKKGALKWVKLYQENDGEYDVSDKIKHIKKELVRRTHVFYAYFVNKR